MKPRRPTENLFRFLRRSEGLRDDDDKPGYQPYPDPAGVWTIGYGHAIRYRGNLLRGKETKSLAYELFPSLSASGCGILLNADVIETCANIAPYVRVATDNQWDALVSLSFNIGVGNFIKSEARKLHNLGRHAQAADAFLNWTRAGGKRLNGLVLRRERERAMYLGQKLLDLK